MQETGIVEEMVLEQGQEQEEKEEEELWPGGLGGLIWKIFAAAREAREVEKDRQAEVRVRRAQRRRRRRPQPKPDAGRAILQFEAWPGDSVFFLGGMFVSGPDWFRFFGTLWAVLVPVVGMACFVWPEVFRYSPVWVSALLLSAYAALVGVHFVFLAGVTFSDPGILPRGPDLGIDPHDKYDAARKQPPYIKHVQVRGPRGSMFDAELRFCQTCLAYRNLRTVHCGTCNNCVDSWDHHCGWLGNCIGRRNYGRFLWALVLTVVVAVWTGVLCWYQILLSVMMAVLEVGLPAWLVLVRCVVECVPPLLVLFYVSSFGIAVFLFLTKHFGLVLHGHTTYEKSREIWAGDDENAHPLSGSTLLWRLLVAFFPPQFPHYVDWSACVSDRANLRARTLDLLAASWAEAEGELLDSRADRREARAAATHMWMLWRAMVERFEDETAGDAALLLEMYTDPLAHAAPSITDFGSYVGAVVARRGRRLPRTAAQALTILAQEQLGLGVTHLLDSVDTTRGIGSGAIDIETGRLTGSHIANSGSFSQPPLVTSHGVSLVDNPGPGVSTGADVDLEMASDDGWQ